MALTFLHNIMCHVSHAPVTCHVSRAPVTCHVSNVKRNFEKKIVGASRWTGPTRSSSYNLIKKHNSDTYQIMWRRKQWIVSVKKVAQVSAECGAPLPLSPKCSSCHLLSVSNSKLPGPHSVTRCRAGRVRRLARLLIIILFFLSQLGKTKQK